MRQSICLVINPIMVDNFAALFNCTPMDQGSDSMMAPPLTIYFSWLVVIFESFLIYVTWSRCFIWLVISSPEPKTHR